jgi:hypothetical protein
VDGLIIPKIIIKFLQPQMEFIGSISPHYLPQGSIPMSLIPEISGFFIEERKLQFLCRERKMESLIHQIH